jgi:tetratricopeptide (TPR) repeat protein
LIKKIEALRDKGKIEHKKGLYDDAIKIYQDAADLAEKNHSDFKFFKKDIIQREAGIFN